MRSMTEHDIPATFALEQVLYPADAWTLAQFRDEISRVPQTRYYLVLEQEGEIIGYAGLFSPHEGADADIATLSVAPGHQRKGYGERLLDALLVEADRRRAEQVFLEVRVNNEAAEHLYAKKGFEVLGLRRDYYGPGIDAVTMRMVIGR